jgi:anti-sigma B factor antagonist
MAADEYFATKVLEDTLVVVFRPPQILDAVTIDRMATRLKALLDACEQNHLVFDFSRVGYLSSSALGMLIGLHRRILQAGRRLKLCGIRDEIMEVFRITKLHTVFDIYKDISSALEACRKGL